jgi:Cytochrome c
MIPRVSWALAALVLITAGVADASPETDYMLNCMGCHVVDGSGAPGKIPALKGFMAKFLALPEGRAYLVRVPGVTQSALDDAQIAALTNWMLGRFDAEHVPAGFEPYTAEEVARYRAHPLTEITATRARLVAQLDSQSGKRQDASGE